MKYLILLLCLWSIKTQGQDMQPGFDLLEAGAFAKAAPFFDSIVKQFPDNKTAKICYARALGLSGSPSTALEILDALSSTNSKDYEVLINRAEALLWNTNYARAIEEYRELDSNFPNRPTIKQGLANAFTGNQQFNLALTQIDLAINLDPNNSNAQLIRKYIFIKKAAKIGNNGAQEEAKNILLRALEDYPKDTALLRALADLYIKTNQWEAAGDAYLQITDSIWSLTGLSLIAHKTNRHKQALSLAMQAKRLVNTNTAKDKLQAALTRYLQALLWNKKYNKAKEELDRWSTNTAYKLMYLELLGSYGLYTGNPKLSITAYAELLSLSPDSFGGNLGIANAYYALKNLDKAQFYAQQTLVYYPNQKDALLLLETIKNNELPQINSAVGYTKDSDNNQAYYATITGTYWWNNRFSTALSYGYRDTKNINRQEQASINNLSIAASYRVHNRTVITTGIGIQKIEANGNNYNNFNAQLSVKTVLFPLHNLEASLGQDIQDFNASLLQENLQLNYLSIANNVSTNLGIGWYVKYRGTQQSDNNSSTDVFTSLYYVTGRKLLLKGGINYQYLSFKTARPALYFSPESFQAISLFAEASGNYNALNFRALVAIGNQKINTDPQMSTLLAEAEVKYNINPYLNLGGYAKYTNNASQVVSGFSFTEVGIRARILLNNPNKNQDLE